MYSCSQPALSPFSPHTPNDQQEEKNYGNLPFPFIQTEKSIWTQPPHQRAMNYAEVTSPNLTPTYLCLLPSHLSTKVIGNIIVEIAVNVDNLNPVEFVS